MDFEKLRELWRRDPVTFAKMVLQFEATDQQVNLLGSVRDNKYTACKSGHGTGKSSAMAILIWWYLICYDNSQVACTAPTSDQLRNVIWSRLTDYYRKMPDYLREMWQITTDRVQNKEHNSCFAVARTSRIDNPDALQGFHAENLLVIVDEASGVPDTVFMPVLGALTESNNRIVLIGNPTRTTGFFYGCFAQESFWNSMTFNAEESSIVEAEQINFWRDRYGVDSDEYRVRVLGEFPSKGDMNLFTKESIDEAMSCFLEPAPPLVWSLDVARYGGDETVLVKRFGTVVKEIKSIQNLDTMSVANFVMREFTHTREEEKPQVILVDSVGIGAGVLDRLREKRFPARGVNAGNKAFMEDMYTNLRAEMYCTLRDKLESKELKLPINEKLRDQLLTIEYTFDTKGRYKLVSKEEMRKKGIKSPDLADAVAISFAEIIPTWENRGNLNESYSIKYNVF